MEPKSKGYRLFIVNHAKQGDHVEYLIRLSNMEDISIEFLERYSSLMNLHENLKRETSSQSFPRFPPKKFFGSTDERFINQRQTELNAYFEGIFSSKELSQLPSMKKWIDDALKKYKKDQSKMASLDKEQFIEQSKPIDPIDNTNIKGKFKEIIDEWTRKMIDFASNETNYAEEEQSEISYKKVIDESNVFNNEAVCASDLFSIEQGDDNNLKEMDNSEEDTDLISTEKYVRNKLEEIVQMLETNLVNDYAVKDVIVPI